MWKIGKVPCGKGGKRRAALLFPQTLPRWKSFHKRGKQFLRNAFCGYTPQSALGPPRLWGSAGRKISPKKARSRGERGKVCRKSDKFRVKNRAACPKTLWRTCGKKKKAENFAKKFRWGLDKRAGIRYNIW